MTHEPKLGQTRLGRHDGHVLRSVDFDVVVMLVQFVRHASCFWTSRDDDDIPLRPLYCRLVSVVIAVICRPQAVLDGSLWRAMRCRAAVCLLLGTHWKRATVILTSNLPLRGDLISVSSCTDSGEP